jgi:hypothetical protein
MTTAHDRIGLAQPLRGLSCALLAFLCLAAQGVGPALAEDGDEELTFEQRLIHQFMLGLGAQNGSGIDYRERSPLVIPPSPNLPPPENPDAVKANAAWPRDPDERARKPAPLRLRGARNEQAKADDSIPLLPSELNRPGARAGAGRVTTPEPDAEMQWRRRFLPSELGYKGGIFGSLFGKQEDAKFTGEPPRTSLTDPPVGLQTPSPAQPYGVKDKGWFPKAFNPFDRGTKVY